MFFFMMAYVRHFFLRLLQIYMHNRQDITETNLKPALLDSKKTFRNMTVASHTQTETFGCMI